MSLPGVGNIVRSSMLDPSEWHLQWDFGASGAVTLDGAESDQDERVLTPVADGGTGLVTIRFPKCRRVRVIHVSVEAPTGGTSETRASLADIDAEGGSATFRVLDYAGALADPPDGAIGRCYLELEAN